MEEIIKSKFQDLIDREIIAIARSFRKNNFDITYEQPDPEYLPTGIYNFLLIKEGYQYLFRDPQSYFNCFYLKIIVDNLYKLKLPIGAFGVCPSRKILLPITLSDFISTFLRTDNDSFSSFIPGEPDHVRLALQKFLQGKQNLITRLFAFYYNVQKEYNSIMAWQIRHKNSATRRFAESQGFFRSEVPEIDTEFYHAHRLDTETLNYIVECSKRVKDLEIETNKEVFSSDMENSLSMVELFYQHLVDIHKPVIN